MKDNLISRQELLNLIDHYIKHEGDVRKKHSDLFVKGMEDGYFRIRSHVLQMPPAQPERKTGHWILVSGPDENGNATYRCSECHCAETHVPVVDVKFCWNCGAKMETDK